MSRDKSIGWVRQEFARNSIAECRHRDRKYIETFQLPNAPHLTKYTKTNSLKNGKIGLGCEARHVVVEETTMSY